MKREKKKLQHKDIISFGARIKDLQKPTFDWGEKLIFQLLDKRKI